MVVRDGSARRRVKGRGTGGWQAASRTPVLLWTLGFSCLRPPWSFHPLRFPGRAHSMAQLLFLLSFFLTQTLQWLLPSFAVSFHLFNHSCGITLIFFVPRAALARQQ